MLVSLTEPTKVCLALYLESLAYSFPSLLYFLFYYRRLEGFLEDVAP